MSRIKVGVIGVGNMGKHHVRVYSQLGHLVNLIGIYDLDSGTSEQVAKDFATKSFAYLDRLLDRVDAVSVAVPSSLHHLVALKCFERGIHVLVEKPLALNPEQGRSMLETAKSGRAVLLVGHIERYNPAIQALKKLLAREEIVAMDFRRLSPFDGRSSDSDVVEDLMIHDIDVLNYLTGPQSINLDAYGLILKSGDSTDYAVAVGQSGARFIVSFTASRITEHKVRKLLVTAQDTYIDVDYLERKIAIYRRTNLANYLSETALNYRQESLIETVLVPNTEPLLAEILDFIHCIQAKSQPLADGPAGLAALELVRQIQHKIKMHRLNES